MASLANVPPQLTTDKPSAEERLALVKRIAGSSQFQRSARLRDFLLYVGRKSIQDDGAEIHEQEIGLQVFGRAPSYDRSQDNIVRVNATELRKRIENYFANDGADEPLILEIPRGGYKPVFHPRPSLTAVAADGPGPASLVLTSPGTVRIRVHAPLILLGAVALVFAVAFCIVLLQNLAMRKELFSWQDKPTLAAFWGGFAQGHPQPDIVLPDASVSTREEIIGRPISLSEYLNHRSSQPVESYDVSADRRADVETLFHHNLVVFGDVRAAQQILAMRPLGASLHLTFARLYAADSIKSNSVILIGGKKADPWVRLFDERMNFTLDYDNVHGQSFVANRHPLPGEQASYAGNMDPNALIGYAVVAYFPNPSHSGNVIILAGTDSDATSAAAEFLTSEEDLSRFQASLHVGQLPYFETLLKISRLNGTSLSAEVLASRTY